MYRSESEKHSLEDPLLSPYNDTTLLDDSPSQSRASRSKWRPWIVLPSLFAILYSISLTLFAFHYINAHTCQNPNEYIYSPAKSAISYGPPQIIDTNFTNNPYVGDPRPEHEEVWHDLMENMHIKVSGDTLNRLNRTSIAYKDGSGYVGMLGVYHELHCIKNIRHYLHASHYYPPSTTPPSLIAEAKAHADHCLEYFRQSAMCRGSLDLVTFQWFDLKSDGGVDDFGNNPSGRYPLPDFLAQTQCVDWEKLDGWNREHRVDLYEYDKLVGS